MTQIKKYYVKDLKAISGEKELDLNGCTAIVFGGNGKGKSTLLTILIDRIRGQKPDVIVNSNAKDGYSFIELTTGEQFQWTVTAEGKEKLVFVTEKGIRTSVTKEIASRFFPPVFDIDEFLSQTPKKQSETLQKLVGIDFSDINARYKTAYDDRTFANKKEQEAKVKLLPVDESLPILPIPTEEIVKELNTIELHNSKVESVKARIESDKKDINDYKLSISDFQKSTENKIQALQNQIESLKKEEIVFVSETSKKIEDKNAEIANCDDWLLKPENALKDSEFELSKKSELADIEQKNAKIVENNRAKSLQVEYDKLKSEAIKADEKVKEIEKEKLDLLKSANLPVGFEITDEGVLIDGLPLDRKQLSTSKIYISALKLAEKSLGEVRCLHFDASTLDRNSLNDVKAWADSVNLQLAIEKPDFDGGDIRYEILS